MDIILIAGLWLDTDVWNETADALRAQGHRPVPVPLPGQGAEPADATLDDQLAAALSAVDAADRPVVVGHSAACGLAWLVADRRPEQVAHVALIGGWPAAEGGTYADYFPVVDGVMAFPGWEPFEGPDAADLDEATRARVGAGTVPVSAGVSQATVHYTDERRYDVPVTLVCPEFGPEEAKGWVASGDVPELGTAKRVEYVDIDSGHWPMITRPQELAAILGGLG